MWVVAIGRCTLSFHIGSIVLGLFSDIMSWFLSGEFFFCVPHSGAEILKTNHISTEGNKLGQAQTARNRSGRYDGSNADWPKKPNCLANSRLCHLSQWVSILGTRWRSCFSAENEKKEVTTGKGFPTVLVFQHPKVVLKYFKPPSGLSLLNHV